MGYVGIIGEIHQLRRIIAHKQYLGGRKSLPRCHVVGGRHKAIVTLEINSLEVFVNSRIIVVRAADGTTSWRPSGLA